MKDTFKSSPGIPIDDITRLNGTYSIRRYCTNCGHHFKEHIPKGQQKTSKCSCPKCGCGTGI